MRPLRLLVAIAIASAALPASGAGAATAPAIPPGAIQLGNECTANASQVNTTALQVANPAGSAFPVRSPIDGVVTQWRVTLPGILATPEQTLKVGQKLEEINLYTIMSETTATLHSGLNVIPARIPIYAGDVVGLYGDSPYGAFICPAGPESTVAEVAGNSAVNTHALYAPRTEAAAAVSVTVEPDEDGDGYGDITQDGCPQSAAFHTGCPVVNLQPEYAAGASAISVTVATNRTAPIQVTGSARLAGRSTTFHSRQKTVAGGTTASFTLHLPPGLRAARSHLAAGRALTLGIRAKATNVRGSASADHLRIRLPGAP